MSAELYYNPKCSTCRVALGMLEEKGTSVKIREYLNEPPTHEELKALLAKLKINPHDLIRTKEKIYQEKYAGKKLTDEEWIDVMVQHPILIQRPILIQGDKAIIGRPAEKVLELK